MFSWRGGRQVIMGRPLHHPAEEDDASVAEEDAASVVDRDFLCALVRRLRGPPDVDNEDEVGEEGWEEEEEEGEEGAEEDWEGINRVLARRRRRLTALKRLWDLSVNRRTCALLGELGVVAAVEGLLSDEHASSREQEVCCGLLANLAGDMRVADFAARNPSLVRRLAEVSAPDPAVLAQTWTGQGDE